MYPAAQVVAPVQPIPPHCPHAACCAETARGASMRATVDECIMTVTILKQIEERSEEFEARKVIQKNIGKHDPTYPFRLLTSCTTLSWAYIADCIANPPVQAVLRVSRGEINDEGTRRPGSQGAFIVPRGSRATSKLPTRRRECLKCGQSLF